MEIGIQRGEIFGGFADLDGIEPRRFGEPGAEARAVGARIMVAGVFDEGERQRLHDGVQYVPGE